MARALIVGCGCRGRGLGTELIAHGWQLRGSSRSAAGGKLIESAGIEAAEADPDHPGTVLDLVGDVTVVVWLLGSATGSRELIEAIHGSRLERLLEKLVDTPVRGFAYEATGSVAPELLAQGRKLVAGAGARWRIPVGFLEDPPGDAWAGDAADRVLGLLNG